MARTCPKAEGKARNRRVEVEVWYDEVDEITVEKEVVISQRLSRIKICRIETVCKLTYKEGHAKRTRVKNLVPPLHFSEESAQIPEEFQAHILQALGCHHYQGYLFSRPVPLEQFRQLLRDNHRPTPH